MPFPRTSTLGLFWNRGVNNKLFCISCRSTYSSKVRLILLPLKFRVESLGSAFNNCGGRLSLGPPPGGITLAQEAPKRKAMRTKTKKHANEKNDFISGANIKPFK